MTRTRTASNDKTADKAICGILTKLLDRSAQLLEEVSAIDDEIAALLQLQADKHGLETEAAGLEFDLGTAKSNAARVSDKHKLELRTLSDMLSKAKQRAEKPSGGARELEKQLSRDVMVVKAAEDLVKNAKAFGELKKNSWPQDCAYGA